MLRNDVVANQEVHGHNKNTDNVTQHNLSMHVVKIGYNDIDEESDDQENLANDSKTSEQNLIVIILVRVLFT